MSKQKRKPPLIHFTPFVTFFKLTSIVLFPGILAPQHSGVYMFGLLDLTLHQLQVCGYIVMCGLSSLRS